jgi:chromosome segregation ATPase
MDPELRETLARFERYFELIQQQLIAQQGQITTMQGQITTMQGQITTMQGEIAEIRADVSTLKVEFAEIRADVSTLKNDTISIRSELASLRLEMTERFISVDEQMRTLTRRVQQFEENTTRELTGLKEGVSQLNDRMKSVETAVVGVHGRIDTLGDDMRQRFRVVNDRLSTIEKRNAA